MNGPRLVLASASPRRLALLRQLGLRVEVRPPEVDEAMHPGEEPSGHVVRLACTKARGVREIVARGPDDPVLVLAGDTVVVHAGQVLGKPEDRIQAEEMLLALAGRAHDVWTGVAVAGPCGMVSGSARASVRFRPFDRRTARAYVATDEPMDKAGAYGIQGMGAALVEEVRGDYTSVVGLPVGLLVSLLERAGWRYAFGRLVPLEERPSGHPVAPAPEGGGRS